MSKLTEPRHFYKPFEYLLRFQPSLHSVSLRLKQLLRRLSYYLPCESCNPSAVSNCQYVVQVVASVVKLRIKTDICVAVPAFSGYTIGSIATPFVGVVVIYFIFKLFLMFLRRSKLRLLVSPLMRLVNFQIQHALPLSQSL